jgi:hypothetical protein
MKSGSERAMLLADLVGIITSMALAYLFFGASI